MFFCHKYFQVWSDTLTFTFKVPSLSPWARVENRNMYMLLNCCVLDTVQLSMGSWFYLCKDSREKTFGKIRYYEAKLFDCRVCFKCLAFSWECHVCPKNWINCHRCICGTLFCFDTHLFGHHFWLCVIVHNVADFPINYVKVSLSFSPNHLFCINYCCFSLL